MNPTIEKIQTDLLLINKNWQNPETLSALILRLALLYSDLGDLVTTAEFEMDSIKERYDYDVAKRTLELVEGGLAVNRADLQAKQEYRQGFRDQLKAKNDYGMLKRKRESLERVLDATRSRLSLIKSDIQHS